MNNLAGLLPLVFVFVIFYFLLIKPQQKKAKEHQDMLNGLQAGAKVIISSGIIGVIDSFSQDGKRVFIKIANNVVIEIVKESIISIA